MFTIDSAIDRCNHIAVEHESVPKYAARWRKMAEWLEKLRDASSYIQEADFKHEPYFPGDNIYDMRDKEHAGTIEQVCEILDSLTEEGVE